MMKNFSKITTIAACLVVALLVLVSPAAAEVDIDVLDNGAGSDTKVYYETSDKTEVKQENDADVENKVDLSVNTGGNKANKNTGGATKVTTGDVETTVVFSNLVNVNSAKVKSCCNTLKTTSIKVSDNGAKSDHKVEVESETKLELEQENEADVENDVEAEIKTGDNNAKGNTNGDVELNSGDVVFEAGVENVVNTNDAVVDGCDCDEDSDVQVKVKNNGSKAETKIGLEVDQTEEFDQENEVEVETEVEAEEVDSGNNNASNTTGGTVEVKTGKMSFIVSVFNNLNFNLLRRK